MRANQRQSRRNSMWIPPRLTDRLLPRLWAGRNANTRDQFVWRSVAAVFVAVFSLLFAESAFAQQNEEQSWGPRERQEWFYHQRAYPLTHTPPGARLRALNELLQMRQAEAEASGPTPEQLGFASASSSWTLIGPQPSSSPFGDPASGRVSAVAVDPTDATGNTVYIGGAQGGVWKTTDGGTSWTPLTDTQFSLALGSLAIDPNNHLNVYAGTGEENFAGDSYYGGGLLKSSDGGSTWTSLGTAYFGGAFGRFSPEFGGSFIGDIAIQPGVGASTPVLLVASQFGGGTQHYYYSGISRSADGGATWTHVLPATFDSNAFGVSVFFVNNTTAHAVIGNPNGDANNGVYISTDSGQTWAPANGSGATALISGTSAGRITLVAAPSNPSTLYASVQSPATNGLAGMFKSTDGGATWHPITTPLGTGGAGSTVDFCGAQCWYDMPLGVSPVNPNLVYAGGSDNTIVPPPGGLYMSTDGGTSWTPVNPNRHVHSDVHAFSFNAGGSKLYVGSDGGMWSTANVGVSSVTWSDLNSTLALTQFYGSFALSGSTPNLALIGTQDNGTLLYSGGLTWNYANCGDGFSTALNPANNNIMWAVCSGHILTKSVDGGVTWSRADNGITYNVPGPPALTMDYENPNTLYAGTDRVWQTTNGAATPWTAISSGLTGGSSSGHITTLAVSPVSSSTLFVGATDSAANSMVWFTTNTGGTWTQIPSGLPPRWVTMVQGDPQNSATFYVTFSGFSGFATGDTFGHVFSCSTASATCTDISSNLPNIPVNDIVIDPAGSNTLCVATDLGVFRSTNAGASWSTFSNGLPNVAVLGLRMHAASRSLLAATHGRSAWVIVVPLGGTTPTTTAITLVPQTVTTGSAGPVVVTATVTPTSGSGTPTGNVSIFNGSIMVGTANLAGDTATFNYNPSSLAGGTYSITATYNGDATFTSSTSPVQTLTVQVLAPVVSLSAPGLPFGNQLVGTSSAAQNVTLTNTGNATLTLTIAITGTNSGDFSATNTCGATVTAGANCSINVTFKPTATGNRAASVTITDNASGSPQAVALTGMGTDFTINVATGGSNTATVTAGQPATYNLQVAPVSGFNGTVTLSCTGAPSEASCTPVPASATPNGNSPSAFAVNVTTTKPSILVPRGVPPRFPPLTWIRILPLVLVLTLMFLMARLTAVRLGTKWALVPTGIVLLGAFVWASGCGGAGGGGGNHDPGTPAGTYTLTVTGTSGGVSRTQMLTLKVN